MKTSLKDNKILKIRWLFSLIGFSCCILNLLIIFDHIHINELFIASTLLFISYFIGFAFLILSSIIPSEEEGLLLFNTFSILFYLIQIFNMRTYFVYNFFLS